MAGRAAGDRTITTRRHLAHACGPAHLRHRVLGCWILRFSLLDATRATLLGCSGLAIALGLLDLTFGHNHLFRLLRRRASRGIEVRA